MNIRTRCCMQNPSHRVRTVSRCLYSASYISLLVSARAPGGSLESIWDDKSPASVLPGARAVGRLSSIGHTAFTSTAGKSYGTTTSLPDSGPSQISVSSQPSIRTLQEIEFEMRAKQQPQNHVSQSSVASHAVAAPNLLNPSSPIHHLPQSNLSLHSSPSQLTPDEVEHQLRMMHLTQLQQHQAQRQEQQQQQPIYQSVPQQRHQYMRTPEQDRQHILQQHQIHRSFSTTPEPQFAMHSHSPQLAQGYITQQQQHNQLMQQQLLVQLSQAGVMPDQIHLLDPVQRDAIMNEAIRKIMAAERLDQRNRRRLIKMERMVGEQLSTKHTF
jgi:DNA topoisomerase 2-associated protein PAT1